MWGNARREKGRGQEMRRWSEGAGKLKLDQKRCICFLVLHNKFPPKLSGLKKTDIISQLIAGQESGCCLAWHLWLKASDEVAVPVSAVAQVLREDSGAASDAKCTCCCQGSASRANGPCCCSIWQLKKWPLAFTRWSKWESSRERSTSHFINYSVLQLLLERFGVGSTYLPCTQKSACKFYLPWNY